MENELSILNNVTHFFAEQPHLSQWATCEVADCPRFVERPISEPLVLIANLALQLTQDNGRQKAPTGFKLKPTNYIWK